MKYLSIFIFFMLFGCASPQLPKNNGDNAVLIIPKSNVNSTTEQWSCRYSLVISQSMNSSGEYERIEGIRTISIDNNNSSYILIDDLPSGNYKIDKIIRTWSPQWRSVGVSNNNYTETNIPFRMVKGRATILGKLIDIKQFDGSFGSGVSVSSEVVELPSVLEASILHELKAGKEFRNWRVETR